MDHLYLEFWAEGWSWRHKFKSHLPVDDMQLHATGCDHHKDGGGGVKHAPIGGPEERKAQLRRLHSVRTDHADEHVQSC